MDVGNFISDLLAKHGQVSVPGLGYFAHTRINGHYNEREGVFYPPSYSVQFNPQEVEDQTLAQYIADRKNISLASSKYFTEKYISSIKLQAQAAAVPFNDIGVFYTEGTELYFKPNTTIGTDANFFGLEPIKIDRLGVAKVEEKSLQFNPQPTQEHIAPPVAIEQEVAPQTHGHEIGEDQEAHLAALARKRRIRSVLVFIALALIVGATVIYLLSRYNQPVVKQDTVAQKKHPVDTVINAKVEQAEDTTAKQEATVKPLPADTSTIKENTPAKDTLSKVSETAPGETYYPRWEVMGGSFNDLKEANKAIKNYKKLNIDAHIVTDAPGRRVKVTLATFKTRAEAVKAIKEFLETKKVSKDIYPLEIKPKL
ncbi:HU domain-containing protein [Mucilaginibacter phyllosphaerae]